MSPRHQPYPLAPRALVLLLCAAGCDAAPAPAPPTAGRVEAVVARQPTQRDLAEFCDVQVPAPTAAQVALPAMENAEAAAGKGPRWINIWATWCKPCLEEMPRLATFAQRLRGDGTAVGLAFVSADEDADALRAHLAAHPELPKTARLADPAALKPWLEQLGLDAGAGLPVHVFTDDNDRVRCVRAGGVTDAHYPFVADVLGK